MQSSLEGFDRLSLPEQKGSFVPLIILLLMLCTLSCPSLLLASGEQPVSGRFSTIDLLLDRAISQDLIAGGVVVVGNHDGILSTSARGQLNATAGSPQLDERSIFDIASLTKVVATTPAVMKLLDEGRINLSDPLSRWFPEFAGSDITILNLLTHTSGLEDVMVSSEQSMLSAVRKAAAQKNRQRSGSHFHYADINFILLGEMVNRVTGERLDAFCQKEIYGPLGTEETMFLPPSGLAGAIAPTSGFSGGIVQDPNARRLGGVAGHAGLFSSAYDLSKYARLILSGGMIGDRRILSEQVVAQMTTPYLCNNGQVKRGLGWDIDSPYSAPRGNFFSSASFGHTGYSGSSIWIDPQQDLFVIVLTRRLNYHDVRNFNQLRRDISTVAAVDLKMPLDGELSAPLQLASTALQEFEAAYPAMPVSRVAKGAARSWQYKLRANRGSAKAERLMAKAHRSHRVTHITRLAKAESRNYSKKRRTLAKG